MSEEDIAQQMARQYGIPYASFENKILRSEIGQNLERLIPEEYARRNRVLPLFVDESVLAVALADPLNFDLMIELKKISEHEVRPFVATATQIKEAIRIFYRKSFRNKVRPRPSTRRIWNIDPADVTAADIVDFTLKTALWQKAEEARFTLLKKRDYFRIDFLIDGRLIEQPSPAPSLFNAVVSHIRRWAKLRDSVDRRSQSGGFTIKLRDQKVDKISFEYIKVEVLDDPSAPENQLVLRFLRAA